MYNYSNRPKVTNCTFSSNKADNWGGGMYNFGSRPTVRNCTFSGNLSGYGGGGMFNDYSSPTVGTCTFSGNSAGTYAGGMCSVTSSDLIMDNCIMWGDSAGTSDDEIYTSDSTSAISYSNICGCGGSGAGWDESIGTDDGGNIDAEPLFFAPGMGDFHLKSEFGRVTMDPSLPFGTWVVDTVTSPCIDAGNPNMGVGNEPEGNGGRINMGAYGGTYQASKSSYVETIEGDVNGDGVVDFKDVAILCNNWLAGTEPELKVREHSRGP
jgi:parallel beta-helix repeat protein